MEHKQYIFRLANNSYHLDDFIQSSSNSQAFKALHNENGEWGYQPFPDSVLLYGPKSSGKTHLVKIWQNQINAYLIEKDQNYSEQLLNSNEAFVIEDIECWDMETLLHFFNILNQNKKQLLLTTDQVINYFDLKDLESRINSIKRITIEKPDDELLKIFLFKLFSNSSIVAPPQVQEYLLNRVPREFEKIIKIVNQINEFALANKRNFTVPLVKEVMASVDLEF